MWVWPGEAQYRAVAQKVQQALAIHHVLARIVWVEVGVERDMHRDDHEAILGRLRQHVGHEGELAFADAPFVAPYPIARPRCGAEIMDGVQHQEQRLAVVEGVVRRSVDPLEGLAAVACVGRLEIEIVIAADMEPGNADAPHDAVRAAVEREIVEQDVARGHAEGGFRPQDARHRRIADMAEFHRALGLRIGEQDHLEGIRFRLARQREIDGGGKRPRRVDAPIAQPQFGGRPLRLVEVAEARDVVLVARQGKGPTA